MLTSEDDLALISAAGSREQAIKAWNELMGSVAFDELNESSQRLTPTIFWNLRQADGVAERDRLRGAFKHAWAKNTSMLRDFLPIIEALNLAGINYRLLKGTAVQLLGHEVGSRIMGDVDLLIERKDLGVAVAALQDAGFRRNTIAACPRHSDSFDSGALNFNRGDCHVDVHIAESKSPGRLLREMLKESPITAQIGGQVVLVPGVELLVLHATSHGIMSISPTDFAQAASDIARLSSRVNPEFLVELARGLGMLADLLEVDERLRQLGVGIIGVRVGMSERRLVRLRGRGTRFFDLVQRAGQVVKVARDRRPKHPDASLVGRGHSGISVRHALWLQLGKIAMVERLLIQVSGRFLPRPTTHWPSGQEASVFADTEVDGLSAARSRASVKDWRFRLRLDGSSSSIAMTLNSAAMEHLDAYVYCDGVPITRVVAGDIPSRSLSIAGVGEDVEVSLRPTWSVCSDCYEGFDDLRVAVMALAK